MNLDKFLKTGDANHLLNAFEGQYFRLINRLTISAIIHLTRRKYIEAKEKKDGKLEKSIDTFFSKLGTALRGKYEKTNIKSVLISRLENYVKNNKTAFIKSGGNPLIYIYRVHETNMKNVKKGYTNQIKKLESKKEMIKEKIKTQKKKRKSMRAYGQTASLNEFKNIKLELEKTKKEISSKERLNQKTGHKEAKRRTLEQLARITDTKIEQRYFEDILAVANKLFSSPPGSTILLKW